MIYNFRHDRSQAELILHRLRNHRELSQGWGGGRGANLDLHEPKFIERTMAHYDGMETTRIPSNLTYLREFHDEDVLVAPHLPAYGTVSLHVVDGDFPHCYRYDNDDESHLNHRIRIRRSFGLDGEVSIYNERLLPWRDKLRAMRYPVLPKPEFADLFSTIIDEMAVTVSARFPMSNLEDSIKSHSNGLKEITVSWLRALPPMGHSGFEAVCERILKSQGYDVVSRNQYNKKGGDADLVCRRSRSDTSIFESGDVTLLVQIKRHTGSTNEEAVHQVIDMLKDYPQAIGCVMSTGNTYTDEASRIAESNGIVLLNKDSISSLFLKLLSELDDD